MSKKTPVSTDLSSFAGILNPVDPADFLARSHDRQFLHIEGNPAKFDRLMSWDILAGLLNMTAVWSSASLQIALDTTVLPAAQYCRPARNRDNQQALQPDAAKVMDLLGRGASLVANDIDTLTPELAGFAATLENAVSGKAQANLYCSRRERQAFGSHFDTHDVYAVHIAGEKLWRLYEKRMDNPIAHPHFKSYGQEWHDRNKGAVAAEILMRPGDLLYIPRGQYHDAVARSDGTIHIAFGVTHVIGMDVFDMLAGLAVDDVAFRRNMPQPDAGEDAARSWLAGLGKKLAAFAERPDLLTAMKAYQASFRYPRGGITLPVTPTARRFRVTARNLKVEERSGSFILASAKGAVPIPDGFDGPVAWIIGKTEFSDQELGEAFPQLGQKALGRMLDDLSGMHVIAAR